MGGELAGDVDYVGGDDGLGLKEGLSVGKGGEGGEREQAGLWKG